MNHEVVDLLDIHGDCVNDLMYDDCMYQALFELSVKEVGCTVPWLWNKSNICTEPGDRDRVSQSTVTV